MADLKRVPANTPSTTISQLVSQDGAIIIDNLMTDGQAESTLEELSPHINGTPNGRDAFSGYNTTRTGALVARSSACRELIVNPRILGTCDDFLLPSCERYQLHLAQVIRFMPGQTKQPLHRDRLVWGSYLQGLEPQLNTLWALTDFTRDNGATRGVLGSAAWPHTREAKEEEISYAEMGRGSVLVYSGTVVHGGGANITDTDRVGLNITYSLGWLRQEENQYLSCPPNIAKNLDPVLQELLGYTMMSYALGYYSHPDNENGDPGPSPPEFALGRRPRKKSGESQKPRDLESA